MKRNTPEHPKTRLLAKELHVPIYAAVGLLELLWHYTARLHRRGDIGASPDREIAEACYWKRDPAILIAALLVCRWLEEHPEHRLIVHDWQDHADDSVKAALKRSGETFVTSVSGNVATCSDKSLQKPSAVASASASASEDTPPIRAREDAPAGPELDSPAPPPPALRFTESDCLKAADLAGVKPDVARAFFLHYAPVDFVDGANRPIRDLRWALAKWAANEPSHGRECRGDADAPPLSLEEQARRADAERARRRKEKQDASGI